MINAPALFYPNSCFDFVNLLSFSKQEAMLYAACKEKLLQVLTGMRINIIILPTCISSQDAIELSIMIAN